MRLGWGATMYSMVFSIPTLVGITAIDVVAPIFREGLSTFATLVISFLVGICIIIAVGLIIGIVVSKLCKKK